MLKQPFICIPGEEQSNHIYLSVDQFYYKLTVSCGQLLKANFSVLPIATTKPLPFSSFFLISAYRCVLQVRSHLKFCWLSCRYELHWGRLSIATMLWRVSLLWPPMLAPTTTNTTFFFFFYMRDWRQSDQLWRLHYREEAQVKHSLLMLLSRITLRLV